MQGHNHFDERIMTDRFSSRDSIPKAAIVARPDYEAWIIVLLLIPGVFIARSFFTSIPEMMDALKK